MSRPASISSNSRCWTRSPSICPEHGGRSRRQDLQLTASLGLTEAADIASEDPERIAAGEALLNRALEITHDLGGRYLVGVLYSVLKYPGPATARGRADSQDVLRGLADGPRVSG